MFNIIEITKDLFKKHPSSYSEILEEFSAEYNEVEKVSLPSVIQLQKFIENFPKSDKLSISLNDISDYSCVIDCSVESLSSYGDYVNALDNDDSVRVKIRVEKLLHESSLNIYNLKSFSDFLVKCSYTQLFDNFVYLFNKCGNMIIFHVLDENVSMRTMDIVFSDHDLYLKRDSKREFFLKNCEAASLFLDRTKYPLIPQDFNVIESCVNANVEKIKNRFEKVRTILSYFYLANTAYISKDKAIFQFDPSRPSEDYCFDSLEENSVIAQIYDWAYKDESCVDKACIARKIINLYCRSKDSILKIDDKVYNSIKSDYVIYQKNHAEQYIDMKNKISEHIVNNVKLIEDLSHDLSDAFRNNFVAVIVFLMTVLLTDSIDISKLFDNEISPNIIAVFIIFTVCSFLYLIVSILITILKWKWIEKSYKDLKRNYSGILDKKDLEECFMHDTPIDTSKSQFTLFCIGVCILWLILIITICAFIYILCCRNNLTGPAYDSNVNSVQIESEDITPTQVESTPKCQK